MIMVPLLGSKNAQNHVDCRGLSRAVRPHEPDDLVLAHLKRNPVDGDEVAVGLVQARY